MRKISRIGMVIGIVLCVIAQYGGISHAGPTGVAGSKHDLSIYHNNAAAVYTTPYTGGGFTYETEQVCVFCHTPHNANSNLRSDTYWNGSAFVNAGGGSPMMLWNRSIDQNSGLTSVAATTAMLTYTSPTMDAGTGQVWAYSLMCLSCHDGVQALNVLHNYPSDFPVGPIDIDGGGSTTPDHFGFFSGSDVNIGGRENQGTDTVSHLENDHPISIDYSSAAGADAGLEQPTIGGGSVNNDPNIRLFPKPGDAPGANKYAMECSTCHDVHNEGSKSATAPISVRFKYPFLAVTVAGSYLCTRCHKK